MGSTSTPGGLILVPKWARLFPPKQSSNKVVQEKGEQLDLFCAVDIGPVRILTLQEQN
jgi:hypothetical protein